MKFTGQRTVGPILGKDWDPRTGWQSVVKYIGLPADLDVIFETWRAAGARPSMEPDVEGKYHTLTVRLGYLPGETPSAPYSDLWSMPGNDLEKSLWESPLLQAAVFGTPTHAGMGLTADLLAQLKADLESFLGGTLSLAEVRNLPASGDARTVIDLYLTERLRGVESFPVSQYVIRRVTTFPKQLGLKPDLSRVGKMISKASFPGLEGMPPDVPFDLPDGFFLKRTPSAEQVTSDKSAISQEWWHADTYSDFIYGAAL
jgi:hypothetical protein